MVNSRSVILKETKFIFVWEIILSLPMQALFYILGEWDYTVLLGNTLSGVVAVLNFFLMGIAVRKAIGEKENDARKVITASCRCRLLMILILLVIGVTISAFHFWAMIPPLLFPRIAIAFRPLFDKKKT
jgi:hypothetical protein